MTNIQDLFSEMETLSLDQLEKLHTFINERPYKLEGREPTRAELHDVLIELRRIVAEPRPVEEEEDPIARIESMMRNRDLH